MKFRFSLLPLFLLSACSIYQSEGRKFLEKQAFTYSGASAVPYLQNCQGAGPVDGPMLYADDRALVFAKPGSPLEIRVVRVGELPFSCDYGFTTESQLHETLSAAVELTLSQGQILAPPSAR